MLPKGLLLVFRCNLLILSLFITASNAVLANNKLTNIESTQAPSAVQLSGEVKQGGLIIGKTAPLNQVLLNGQPLKVSAKGNFAFGFSRDDTTTYELIVKNNNGLDYKKSLIPAKRE